MSIILVEGESKSMKTSVGQQILEALDELGKRVIRADAGSFFRKVTVCVWDQLDAEAITSPTAEDFSRAALKVLDSKAPYDLTRDWGDSLHSARVDHTVGTVSQTALVQEASKKWWLETPSQALESDTDVLVLDGRNPRARLQPWLDANHMAPTLELFCVCDPVIAAERTLKGRGIEEPTEDEKAHEQAAIEKRRYEDRHRDTLAFIDPPVYESFEPGMDPVKAIQESRDKGGVAGPLPVRIDTGTMTRDVQRDVVVSLVRAALSTTA